MSNNPYQSPATARSWGSPAIPAAAVEPLRGGVMTLRIIIFALTQGVLIFAIYAVVQNLGKPHTLAGNWEPLNLIMLAMGAVALFLAPILPPVIFRQMPDPRVPGPRVPAHPATSDPEAAAVLVIQARWQSAAIVGAALLEGAAFGNAFAYSTTCELLHLGIVGLCLLGIAAFFPLPGSSERRIERELERQKEAAALRSFSGSDRTPA
jgi:hypothetical protein